MLFFLALASLAKPTGHAASIELPEQLDYWLQEGSSEVGKVQARLKNEFTKWFGKGYAAIGPRRTPGKYAYLRAPWSDYHVS